MQTNSSALIIPPPGSASTAALTNDIRGVKAPVPVPNSWDWVWWALAAAALVALAVWAWKWWRKKQLARPSEPPIPPHVRAKRKLQAALAHIQDPRRFCFHISEALRTYLEERFQFHAPERTTEEFLGELQASRRLLPDQKQSLAEIPATLRPGEVRPPRTDRGGPPGTARQRVAIGGRDAIRTDRR